MMRTLTSFDVFDTLTAHQRLSRENIESQNRVCIWNVTSPKRFEILAISLYRAEDIKYGLLKPLRRKIFDCVNQLRATAVKKRWVREEITCSTFLCKSTKIIWCMFVTYMWFLPREQPYRIWYCFYVQVSLLDVQNCIKTATVSFVGKLSKVVCSRLTCCYHELVRILEKKVSIVRDGCYSRLCYHHLPGFQFCNCHNWSKIYRFVPVSLVA